MDGRQPSAGLHRNQQEAGSGARGSCNGGEDQAALSQSANVLDLADKLRQQGIISKQRVGRNGKLKGGVPFARGALHHLLSNRTYVGEVLHKGKIYPGEHDAIVDRKLFDAVQERLAARTNTPLEPGKRGTVSLLAGMIHDDLGRPMTPIHTPNHGKRYRYHASHKGDGSKSSALRLHAGDLDEHRIIKAILDGRQPRQVTARFLSRLGALSLAWSDQRKLLGFAAS